MISLAAFSFLSDCKRFCNVLLIWNYSMISYKIGPSLRTEILYLSYSIWWITEWKIPLIGVISQIIAIELPKQDDYKSPMSCVQV